MRRVRRNNVPEAIPVLVSNETLIFVIEMRREATSIFHAFTEPHPISEGWGITPYDALKQLHMNAHKEIAELESKEEELPMSQRSRLALLRRFKPFLFIWPVDSS
jgi:hypothetical protein